MFEVAGKPVGSSRAFLISEIGSNHQGDPDTARKLIQAAALAGADAVKVQVRTNRDLYTKAYYDRVYDSENSFGQTYGQHREFLELRTSDHLELKAYAESLGLVYFATAFDHSALDTCMDLGFGAIKIASGSVTNTPLLISAARTGLPIFLSTGGCHMSDVDRAVNAIWDWNDKLCVLQATASYPCTWEELDLAVINTYAYRYPKCVIGLSSHVPGISDGPAGYVLGARVFEKHTTLHRSSKGTDHAFSLEPEGLRKFVRDIRRMEVAVGDGRKKRHLSEVEPISKMSSSLYFSKKLKAGHVLRPRDICIKSPGGFVPPYDLMTVLGCELINDVQPEQAVTWEVLASHDVAEKRSAV